MTANRDRTVLTTGANSGIGLATTIELARRGFRSVGSVRSSAKAEIVHAAAAEAGVEVETVLLDVTDAPRCEEVVAEVEPWGLVNNAGFPVIGTIEDVGDDEARLIMETMAIAPMRLARLALPFMRGHGGGRVVNISSIAGRVTAPMGGWYFGSKHALEALSDALRAEVARDGIKVVLVEPGGFRTGIWDETRDKVDRILQSGTRDERAYERTLRLVRMLDPIMGTSEQCARVVADVISKANPRPCYLVGVDAQATNLASRLTPPAVQDRVTRLVLGI